VNTDGGSRKVGWGGVGDIMPNYFGHVGGKVGKATIRLLYSVGQWCVDSSARRIFLE
jgi:hypothetical protein